MKPIPEDLLRLARMADEEMEVMARRSKIPPMLVQSLFDSLRPQDVRCVLEGHCPIGHERLGAAGRCLEWPFFVLTWSAMTSAGFLVVRGRWTDGARKFTREWLIEGRGEMVDNAGRSLSSVEKAVDQGDNSA